MSNVLFVVVGPSGSGKTSLFRKIMPNEIRSFTTRAPRKGETEKDYNFISKNRFDKMLKENGLIEYTEYDGNFYGISKNELQSNMNLAHGFVVVDRNGMEQLNAYYDNCINVHIYATKEDCLVNMLDRGDSLEKALKRLETYEQEVEADNMFDYVIKNVRHNFSHTYESLSYIVASEVVRRKPNE